MAAIPVHHEPPSQRRQFRVTSPAEVIIEGTKYSTTDWGIGGFRLESYDGAGQPGDRIRVGFSVNFQDFEISFGAEAEILRRDQNIIAARFSEIGERESELLQHFVTSLVSGQVIPIQGVLKHIDRPVTKVPLSVNNEQPRVRRKRSIRRVVVTAIYLVLGFVIGGYALLTLSELLMRVNVDTAVTSLPLEQIVSMDVGTIRELYAQPGGQISPGQVLFRVDNEIAERIVEQARQELKSAEVDLREAQEQTALEQTKMRAYQAIGNDQFRAADAKVKALESQRDQAKTQFDRFAKLWEYQIISRQVYDTHAATLATQEALLKQAVAEREIIQNSNQTMSGGLFFSGNFLVGDLRARVAQEASARDRLKLAQEALQEALDHQLRRTYHAPFRGTVMRVFKSSGMTVDRGEALVVLRREDADIGVDAYLTQTEAGGIGAGTVGAAFIPATGKRYQVRVISVDRTAGFLKDIQTPKLQQPQWGWRNVEDRSAYAKLAFVDVSTPELASLGAGLPVQLSVPKQRAWGLMLFPTVRASSKTESAPRLWPAQSPLFNADAAKAIHSPEFESVRKRVIEAADRALPKLAEPVEVIHSAGVTDRGLPDYVASHRAFQDADNFVLEALAYKLTGKREYADSARAIVNAWAHVNKPTGNPIDETRLGAFLWGLDLLGMDSQSREVRRWLESWRQANVEWKPGPRTETNNHKTHHLKILLMLDRLLGLESDYQHDLAEAENHLKLNLASADGASLDYQERDALHYHVFDLEAWNEIALVSGCCGPSIDRAFAFFDRTIREHPDHIEFAHSSAAIDRKRAEAGFEYAQAHPYNLREAARCIFAYSTLPGRHVSRELWRVALDGRQHDNLFYEARYYLWQARTPF